MKDKDFYIIKNTGGLSRLKDVLEEYQVYDTNNENIFLLYGYKTLHDGAKQTYKVLTYLKGSLRQNPIKVSLDLLSTILGTSDETQSSRLKELENHKLIKIIKKPYAINQYQLLEVFPDFTFAETIYKLIRRQMVSNEIYQLKNTSNPVEKISIYENLKNLQSLIPNYEKEDIFENMLK